LTYKPGSVSHNRDMVIYLARKLPFVSSGLPRGLDE